MINLNSIDILMIEDNAGDFVLTKEALENSKLLNYLHHVEDGIEAMAFLHQEGIYKNYQLPGLILLDLNLPKKDGREVLAEIKSDPKLKHIPVVILTSSEAETDILQSYQIHANCYITKPVDLDQFMKTIKGIGDFWFSVVKLPK
jgi:chemotaxis family two-component system response regulator Rcp1